MVQKTFAVAATAFSVFFAFAATGAMAGVNGWDHVGNGGSAATASLDGNVYVLHADGRNLYAGGAFTHAGGTAAAYIAKWDGNAWTGFPPLNGAVHAITLAGGRLFAGGVFTDAGGNANADFLAAWDGVTWAPFCNAPGPAFNGNVVSLQVIGNTLYVGGSFVNGAGIISADYLLACDLTTGAARSTVPRDGDIGGSVYALTADKNGTLYAGGTFSNLGGNLAIDYVGAYDGTWHPMGSGPSAGGGSVDTIVRALASDGTNVYVGTDASSIGGIAGANHVARWDGAWHAMGSNYFSTLTSIYSLAISGPLVFAGGSFQNAGGDARADQIAYWDGSAWHSIGSDGAGEGPYNRSTDALAIIGARVFAGGSFTSAGADSLAKGIAQSPIQQADAQIGATIAGAFIGNGIYSAQAAGESKSITVKRGKRATFYLKVENDGLISDSYLLRAVGKAKGFTVTYSVAGSNVTARLKAGTYRTSALLPGVALTIKAVVTVAKSSTKSAVFIVSGAGNESPTDAVKAVVRAK
jgi:hypothetical protein